MGSVNERTGIKGEVCVVLEDLERVHAEGCPWWADPRSKACQCGVFEIHIFENIITNAGDQFYAEAAAKGITGVPASTTDDFDTMTVATVVTTAFGSKTADAGDVTTVPSMGTKTITTGYPQVSDPDTNNPGTVGVDILTWKAVYTTSEAVGTLVGLCIHETGATFGSGSNPLLMSVDFSPSIVKGSGQAINFYVNHMFDGQ